MSHGARARLTSRKAATRPARLAGARIDPRRFGYEGNPDGSVRLVQNVPGMWLIEQCRSAWANEGLSCSYQGLIESARECAGFESYVDPFWEGFVYPEKMPEAVAAYCRETSQAEPHTPGEVSRAIFVGLAKCCAHALDELRGLTVMSLPTLIVVGGGAQNELLNELTAEAAGVDVHPGHVEASTIGNIMNQQLALQRS